MRLDMYVRKHHAKLQIVPTVSRVDVSGGQMKVDGDGLQNKSDSSLVPTKRLAKLTNIRGEAKGVAGQRRFCRCAGMVSTLIHMGSSAVHTTAPPVPCTARNNCRLRSHRAIEAHRSSTVLRTCNI